MQSRILLLLFLSIVLFSTPQAFSQTIDPEIAAKDARLQKKVSFFADRLFLFDLLAELQQQTGVTISVDSEDPFSGLPLMVSLKANTLQETLDALWSVLSYRNAQWKWQVRGEAPNFRYHLLRTPRAHEVSALWKRKAQEAVTKQVIAIIEASRLSPERRKSTLESFSTGEYKFPKEYIEYLRGKDSEPFWTKVRSISDELTTDEIRDVFNGMTINREFSKLPETFQRMIASRVRGIDYDKEKDSLRVEFKPIQNSTSRFAFTTDMLMLVRRQDRSSTGPSVFSTMFVEGAIWNQIAKDWLHPNEKLSSPYEERLLGTAKTAQIGETPNPTEATLHPRQTNAVVAALSPIVRDSEFAFIGVPLEITTLEASNSDKKTLKEHLQYIAGQMNFNAYFKWNERFLMMNHPLILLSESARIPQKVYVNIRSDVRSNQGFISIPMLIDTARNTTDLLWSELEQEYPSLNQLTPYRKMLQVALLEGIFTDEGAVVTPELRRYWLKNLSTLSSISPANITRIRWRVVNNEAENQHTREYLIECFTGVKGWEIALFYIQSKPKPTPAKP